MLVLKDLKTLLRQNRTIPTRNVWVQFIYLIQNENERKKKEIAIVICSFDL